MGLISIKSTMKAPSTFPRRPGFTLTEILVVIAILIILAALSFLGISKAMESARIAHNTQKLRELGSLLGAYAGEYGHYPPGWDPNYDLGPPPLPGKAIPRRGMDITNAWQGFSEIHEGWLSPTVEGRLVAYNGSNQPTNYSGHPRILYNPSTGGDATPIAPITIPRPSEVFLLCDAVPKNPADVNDPASAKNAQTGILHWYEHINKPIRGSEVEIASESTSGGVPTGPDFRNRGKCHVVFCDGHVEAFEPGDFKQKHVSLAY